MFFLLFLSYIAVSIFSIVRFDFGITETAFSVFNVFCFYSYFKRRNLKDNFSMLMLWGYIFLSSSVVAAFEYQTHGFAGGTIFTHNDFRELALFSNHILLCVSIPMLFQVIKKPSGDKYSLYSNYKETSGTGVPKRVIVSLLLVAYALSFLSKALGMSDVEDTAIILPFHLNGFIDEYRRYIFPFIFAIYIYDCVTKGKRIDRVLILAYFIWAIIEMLVRISKGAFLVSFLPVFVMLFLMGKFNQKTATTIFLPVIAVFLVFYPVIENIRNIGDNSAASYSQAFESSRNKDSETSSPYLRIFINGMDYLKVKDVVAKDNTIFCFNRAPLLVLIGGTAPYITYEIDNTSRSSHHSSGTTGIVDPLLWGGYGLCYVFMVLFSMIAMFVDQHKFFRRNLLYQLIAILFLKNFFMAKSVSFFFDPLFIASSVTVILEILCVRYYNRHYLYKLRGVK